MLFKTAVVSRENILSIFIKYNSPRVINIETMCKGSKGISKSAIELYIQYLADVNLINISEQLNTQAMKVE